MILILVSCSDACNLPEFKQDNKYTFYSFALFSFDVTISQLL